MSASAKTSRGMIVGTQLITRLAGSGRKSYVVLGGLFLLGLGAGLLGAFRNTAMAALSTFHHGFRYCIRLDSRPDHVPAGNATGHGWTCSSTFMSLIAVSQVFGLVLSGYLAQKLAFGQYSGLRRRPCVISITGHFLMRGRTPHSTGPGVPANATPQSSAASLES